MQETLQEQVEGWIVAAIAERQKIKNTMGPLSFSAVEMLGNWEGQIEMGHAVLGLLPCYPIVRNVLVNANRPCTNCINMLKFICPDCLQAALCSGETVDAHR